MCYNKCQQIKGGVDMSRDARDYMAAVVAMIIKKYGISEIDAYKMVKKSFVYDSLERYPDETLHDDIETNADLVYQDSISEQLLEM